jgi:hypothetical protein
LNWLEHTRRYTTNPAKIDLTDRAYYVPCFRGTESLANSIEHVGILNTPVVQERQLDHFVPVLGRRRLQVASQLGITSVEVRVIPASMPEEDGFLMAFWDNAAHRRFDPACTAVVVKRVLELYPRDVVARQFLPVLGVPPRGPRLEQLRALGDLEEPVLLELASGRIHEKTALLLSELQPQERMALLDFTEKLGLNANKKAEVIERLLDLSIFHDKPVLEFVQAEDAQAALADTDIPLPERANRFRDLLRSWKFPQLAKKEAEFRVWSETLPRSDRLSVRPTRSVEVEQYDIEIRADSKSKVERLIHRIKDEL